MSDGAKHIPKSQIFLYGLFIFNKNGFMRLAYFIKGRVCV